MSTPKYSRVDAEEDTLYDAAVPAYSPLEIHTDHAEPSSVVPQQLDAALDDSTEVSGSRVPWTIWGIFTLHTVVCAATATLATNGLLPPSTTLLLYTFFSLFVFAAYLYKSQLAKLTRGSATSWRAEQRAALKSFGLIGVLVWSIAFATLICIQPWGKSSDAKFARVLVLLILAGVTIPAMGIVWELPGN